MRSLVSSAILLSTAVTAHGQAGRYALSNYLAGLNQAKSLSVDYTVQPIGSPQELYSVQFQKPNKFRLETPEETIVGDGQTLVRFDKSTQQFARRSQQPTDLGRFLSPSPLRMWVAFFDPKFVQVGAYRDLGRRERSNTEFQVVETASGQGKLTYFLDVKTGRAMQYDISEPGRPALVVVVRDFEVDSPIAPDAFKFDTSRAKSEISETVYDSPRWMMDLVAATALAKKTGRKVYVDFVESKNPTTDKMEREVYVTSNFKSYSNRLVFVRIERSKAANVAKVYGVEKFPTQLVLDDAGEELASNDEYTSAAEFLKWLAASVRVN
jgi:outer membrane lipoprotein-sorting protein